MASGSHYGQGREFRQLNQGKPHGFLHHVSNHSAADKNMKEVRGSQGGGFNLVPSRVCALAQSLSFK